MSEFDFLNDYVGAIYGYAVNRSASTNEAEDLTQDVLLAAMESFKQNPGVGDRERYLWKIAHNVYVDHVRKAQLSKNQIDFSQISNALPVNDLAAINNLEDKEQFGLMRREIARLSQIRRKIIVMHYFEEQPVKKIADKLCIPVGTVKWHLSGSRSEIEKGMNIVRTNGNLSMNPVKFKNISYCGNEDSYGGPQQLLSNSIKQNILYAAYKRPMTITEIADEMGVSPPYVRDEVEILMDFNFVNEVESQKYQTNIVILEDQDGKTLLDDMFEKVEDIAKQLYNQLAAAYVEAEPAIVNSGVYVPGNDAGYLRWTAFVQSVVESLAFIRFDNSNLPVHKDGHYITMVHRASSAAPGHINPRSPNLYFLNGPMINWQYLQYAMWRVDHNWVKRDPLHDYGRKDIELTSAFREGRLPMTSQNAESYKFLLDNGLLIKVGDRYLLNIIFADTEEVYKKYKSSLPNLKHIFEPLLNSLSAALYAAMRQTHPAHVDSQIQKAAYIMSTYTISPLIIKNAMESSFLRTLSEKEQKAASILIGKFGNAFA
jgi:RNA polymerase sigma factor (sigma-70 family)